MLTGFFSLQYYIRRYYILLFTAMRRFYKMADRNGDGKVTDLEMLKFSRDNFAKYVDMLKVSRALNSVDTDKNGKLSFYGK